jgi:hypothetical protein
MSTCAAPTVSITEIVIYNITQYAQVRLIWE